METASGKKERVCAWEREVVIWKDEAEDSCSSRSSSSVRGCLLKRTCVKHAVCISVGLWQLPVTSRPPRNSCWESVCICVPPCVIASVCWCKSHVKCAGGGVEEVRCVGCKHFVCLCYVIQQQWNKWHTLICLSGSTVCGEQLSRSKHLSALMVFLPKSNESWDHQPYHQTRIYIAWQYWTTLQNTGLPSMPTFLASMVCFRLRKTMLNGKYGMVKVR